jgi:hypothetical protein
MIVSRVLRRKGTDARMTPGPPPTPPSEGGFEFELTDFQSAREALDESVIEIARHNARPIDAAEWERRRRPLSPVDKALTGEAITWMLSLPESVRPEHLAERMPRLANQIAAAWNDKARCLGALRALTVDDRGGRRGLPVAVLADVRGLQQFLADAPD